MIGFPRVIQKCPLDQDLCTEVEISLSSTGNSSKHALHQRPQGSQRFLKTSDGTKKESKLYLQGLFSKIRRLPYSNPMISQGQFGGA